MCGIIGALGTEPVAPRLVAALKRLEYRGYDSAGVATIEHVGRIDRRRAIGKLRNLEGELGKRPLGGAIGIGHTRWATHGAPSVRNAHPHVAGSVAIVHNGIIENFRELRAELASEGHVFDSETDSEVIAALVESARARGLAPTDAVISSVARMRGAYAIAVLFADLDNLLVGARRGSPLVAGFRGRDAFLGSDAIAVAPFAEQVMYLEEGDVIELTPGQSNVYDALKRAVRRPQVETPKIAMDLDRGPYAHFMLKEIHEQPETIARTVSAYIDVAQQTLRLPAGAKLDFAAMRRLHIVACGTAHYAGRVAKYWFERTARLPVECEIASEYRYRRPHADHDDAMLVVSQSGETADTLAAMRQAAQNRLLTAAVVNVPTSTMARECDALLPTMAGVEIGVASTKAFTAQLTALAALAGIAARARGSLDRSAETAFVAALSEIPRLVTEALGANDAIEALAADILDATSVIYLGRDAYYPMALEGALKLKEISYIHAEGFAGGELKHGPIALIAEGTPVVFVAPHDELFEKSLSNLHEVVARGARVILMTDRAGIEAAGDAPWRVIEMPAAQGIAANIVSSIPLQLLAYHVARLRGADVDQPRNLAKSVTVE